VGRRYGGKSREKLLSVGKKRGGVLGTLKSQRRGEVLRFVQMTTKKSQRGFLLVKEETDKEMEEDP